MSVSVLIVEDDTAVLTLIQHLLAQRGYDVRCATTVDEAAAMMNAMPLPCLVLWDPLTLQMSPRLVAQTVRRGVHVATIPVSVTSTGQSHNGSPIVAKRLTSRDAIWGVVREHCPAVEQPAI